MHKPNRSLSSDAPVEQESQIILRLPQMASQSLREAIREGNLKDRLFISMEPDMRRGNVRFDNWYLPAKIMDLPTITEAYKTIDRKNFYKTADICQVMLCKEDDEGSDEESPNKKRRDTFKVEKKFLYPHGMTPPLKNVRKRRFRRTTRKKFVEAPEIEKEVKRLLRMDNEAVHVRWDVSNEEQPDAAGNPEVTIKEELGVHDIFGEELSDSDEDVDRDLSRVDDDSLSISKFSPADSNMSNTMDASDQQAGASTQFESGMLCDLTLSPSAVSVKREPPDTDNLHQYD